MSEDHRPIPGPLHWDWRCLVCSRPVDDHPGLLARLRLRWRRRTTPTLAARCGTAETGDDDE